MIQIEQNRSFGQCYLSEPNSNDNLRVPRQRVNDLFERIEVTVADAKVLGQGGTITRDRQLSEFEDLRG